MTAYNMISFQNKIGTKHDLSIKKSLLVIFGASILALASQLSIPLQPVPLTFQSTTVVLLGMTFGMRRGASMVALYLLAGACGLPIFADYSGGIHHFFRPTGGYLMGFLPAVMISGYLAERGLTRNLLLSFMTSTIGVSIIFLTGVSFLSLFTGFNQAVQLGLVPFILSEIVKLLAVSTIAPRFRKTS